jgi:hypothetical protein
MKKDSSFAIAYLPTPIWNSPSFAQYYSPQFPQFLEKGLLKSLEYIALPGTFFQAYLESPSLVRLESEDYPQAGYSHPFFIRSVSSKTERSKKKKKRHEILHFLTSLEGLPYVWGGNWHRGIEAMEKLYSPPPFLSKEEKIQWNMQGVDCSGLLYEATEGFTPRNTSELIHFGMPLFFANKNHQAIAPLLKPLDLLVWRGHVVIVLNERETIESSHAHGGVIRSPLLFRLEEILRERSLVMHHEAATDAHTFSIRRWHGEG